MNVWIIIGIGIVAIVGVCYAIYKRKINKAREQQRLTLTQNISHELKTPVASIRGALETILMHPDMSEEERLQFIERAYQQSGRLTNLVEEISKRSTSTTPSAAAICSNASELYTTLFPQETRSAEPCRFL